VKIILLEVKISAKNESQKKFSDISNKTFSIDICA